MNSESPLARFPKPPPQENYRVAVERSVEALARQTPEQLAWLGAVEREGLWRVAVLEDTLAIDLASGRITTSAGAAVKITWQVLVLHYLVVSARPHPQPPEVSFADLPSGRGYAGVYDKRVIKRLCGTAGRNLDTLRRAAEGLGARQAEGGDAAFRFNVFPRLPVQLVWHASDEEFPPSATVLLPGNAEEWFCTEDIVVLCESLVARLSGRPF
jgi:hypothetical protein